MGLLGILLCFSIGVATTVTMIALFQKERLFDSARFLQGYKQQIQQAIKDRQELAANLKIALHEKQVLETQLHELKSSNLQLADEIETLELAWTQESFALQSTR